MIVCMVIIIIEWRTAIRSGEDDDVVEVEEEGNATATTNFDLLISNISQHAFKIDDNGQELGDV